MPPVAWLEAGEQGHFLRPSGPVEQETPRLARANERQRPPAARESPAVRDRGATAPAKAGRDTPGTAGDDALLGAQRLRVARAYVGTSGADTEPFVARVLRASGQAIDLPAGTHWAKALHGRLTARARVVAPSAARPGDVVFFRNTRDLNGNKVPDDGVTFAALVESVEQGRVVFIGQRAGRVRRMALHAQRPSVVRDDANQVINTRLVRWPGQPAAMTAGECFEAFARP